MKHIKLFENFVEINENIKKVTAQDVVDIWYERMDDTFFQEFIEMFPTKKEFQNRLEDILMTEEGDEEKDFDDLWYPEAEIGLLEDNFRNFPGEDIWVDFYNDLGNSEW